MNYKVIAALLISIYCTATMWGWGGKGHSFQADVLFEELPDELQNFFSTNGVVSGNQIRKYASYPDQCAVFNKEQVGAEALALLERQGAKNSYHLHSHKIAGKGPALSFILLVKAMSDKDRERASLWTGSLLHAVGDDCACNHSPLIHYLTYAFRPQKIIMGKGIGLDFGDMNTPQGREFVAAALKNYTPRVVSEDPNEVLRKILTGALINNAFLTEREGRIAATFNRGASPEIADDGMRAMAELGAESVKQVADLVVTAWQFAREGKVPELTQAIMQAAQKENSEYLQSKPLEKDSIFAGLLHADSGKPAVGVIIEPTRMFNQGAFSGGSKYILAGIMHTMKNAGVPYFPLDIRDVEKKGLPAPARTPVLVICAGGFYVSKKVTDDFTAYTKAGGRLLWIGGKDRNLLGELSATLKPAPDDMLPVTPKYGNSNLAIVNKLSVQFLAGYRELLGEKEHRFVKNPNTPAGWHKPVCVVQIASDNAQIRMLAQVSDGNKSINVAGALLDEKGQVKYIFLPEYLLAPFLLSDENTLLNPASPYLDIVGRRVLAASLKMLWPDLKNVTVLCR